VTDLRALKVLEGLAESAHTQQVLRQAVLEAVKTSHPNTIHCGLLALGESGNREHADFVAQFMAAHSLAAIGALAELGGPRARDHLAAAFDQVPTDRWFVLAGNLARLGDAAVVPRLKERLKEVELPPSERFPPATVSAFVDAIRSLQKDEGAPASYSFSQGVSFRYPFDGPGLPKTFSVGPPPQDHYVRLPDVDSETPAGRRVIWSALAESTEGPGFTIDGDRIVTFHGLLVAPLWTHGKPYPTTFYDWVNETPHSLIRDQMQKWLAEAELHDGPMPGSRTMRIASHGPLVALDPRNDRLFGIFLKKTTEDSQYVVTILPMDPLRQLVGVNWQGLPTVVGFTAKRYTDLYDLESGVKDGALNLNDAHRVTMTKEKWRHPPDDAILVAEFAGGKLAFGVPGAAEFLLVDDVEAWDSSRRTAETLAAEADKTTADLPRVEREGAVFYRLDDPAPGRVFAFAAQMPEGLPVAGVLKLTRINPDEQTVRIEHRFVPTNVARTVFEDD
jgi:hypothetical protein